MIALLTDDAWLAMPPAPHEYHGLPAIARFLRASATGRAGRRYRLDATGANGQPAFLCYLSGPDGSAAADSGLLVLTTRGNRIAAITRFLDPRLTAVFRQADAAGGSDAPFGYALPTHSSLPSSNS